MAVYHNVRGTVTYTIVGSPTIVDGVATNFSNNNYIQTSTGNITSSSGQLGFIFTTSTDGNSSFCNLFTGTNPSTDYSRRIEFLTEGTSPRFRIYWEGLDSVWQAYNFPVAKNTKYKCVFSWTPTTISLSLQDLSNGGEVKTESQQLTTEQTSISFVQPQFLRSNYAYDTKLDLNGTYIITDGLPLFGMCPIEVKKHQVMGPVGYTVVGSPTITDGVASGFSASNCLAISQQLDTSKPFEMTIPFKVSTTGTTEGIIGFPTAGLFMLWLLSGKKLKLSLSQNTTDWSIGEVTGSTVLDVDTDYIVKILFTGTKYSFSLSADDGATWTNQGEISSTSLVNDGSPISLQLGRMHSNNYYLRGSINLNYATIKVNGKLWFWQPQETKKIIVNGVEVYSKP